MPDYGLGRLPAPDDRDMNFLMAAAIPHAATDRQWKYWTDGYWFGDQGRTSQCVEYTWHHWVQAGPVKPRGRAPYWQLGSVYREAQTIDEWPGENYDGTSVRAGAKVLQRLGYIDSYLWAWDINTLVNALLTTGPVAVGTVWYDDMFDPDPKTGLVKPTGYMVGGHAYLATGVNKRSGKIRFKNSWSQKWGKSGRFWMLIEDFEKLLDQDGEACLAVENKP